METVGVAEAKEHLEELIARAARGEEVVIVDPVHGSATLRIVAQPAEGRPRVKRQPGKYKDIIPRLPDEFFAPLDEEELKLWYGDAP